jgi:hypothetical protein
MLIYMNDTLGLFQSKGIEVTLHALPIAVHIELCTYFKIVEEENTNT